MQRFWWQERREKLNWRVLSALDVADVVRRGDPAVLEPYAWHLTFARLPAPSKDPQTRNAWLLVHILQLSMEYLLFMRAKDGNGRKLLSQELRQVQMERDGLLLRSHKLKARVRSGDEQVEKLHQVLERIAKLLQIYGTLPSAVATIATLLTDLVNKRDRRGSRKKDDDGDGLDELLRPTRSKARGCGVCGKVFSSVEFLEKHLLKHNGESVEEETPVKHTMGRDIGEGEESTEKSVASTVAMQKMIQRVEQMLPEHEKKMCLLVREEAQKIKQMHEQLHAEAKLAIESGTVQMKDELRHVEAQRQLDEAYLQKQKAEEGLADLKQQIQFLTLKVKTIGAATDKGVPTILPYKINDALVAVEIMISDSQHKLNAVDADLITSRAKLAQAQALHLSALRKKARPADTLTLSRGVSAVMKRDQMSQTELPVVTHKVVQTDEQGSSRQSTSEILIKACSSLHKGIGTDALALTVGVRDPSLIDEEVQMDIDDLDSALTLAASPVALEPTSQGLAIVEASQVAEDGASHQLIVPEDDKRIPNCMHQTYRQDLVNIMAERAQSAASKAVDTSAAPKKYSFVSRNKCVRSRFQHDEDLVKKRVASCLLQLEQFARQFGVSARSTCLSEDNVQAAQQAFNTHLEVLPTEVLTKMVDCENTVNVLLEKEWVSMEKVRLQAME